MQVNMYEAKTRLSRLVSQLDQEGEIVIAKHGKPVAKLIPYEIPKKRPWGVFKGKVDVPDDFDDFDEDIARMFGTMD